MTFTQKENIGFQYVLEQTRPSSPYGQQLLRDLTPMGPGQKPEIQRQMHNIRRILEAGDCQKPLQQLSRLFMGLKMVRPTAQKCREADLNAIRGRFDDIYAAAEMIIGGNIDGAMNKYSK